MSFLVIHMVKTIEWSLRPIFTSDFFFILGELTCGRGINYLCWINIDTLKVGTSVTNKELPFNLEFRPRVNSLGDFYETNKKRSYNLKQNSSKTIFLFLLKKTSENPHYFHHWSTNDKQHKLSWLHLGNIQQHKKFIKFLKQHKFGVSGTVLDDYTNFLCAFTKLLWYTDAHYNKIK